MAEDRIARSKGWVWATGLVVGCGGSGLELPPGSYTLQATDASAHLFSHGPSPGGTITVESGGCGEPRVQVALWTPGLGTPGGLEMSALPTPTAHGGEVWLSVPVETGVGEGQAALWWSPSAGLARLPLGGRAGELELSFEVTARAGGPVPESALASIAAEARAWDEGAFLLEDEGGRVVGAIELAGAQVPPRVGVWDPLWLSDGLVPAARADDGGDLVLQFPAAPQLGDGESMLRLNVATRRVVVPAAPTPSPMDRWLLARPGRLDDAAMEAAIAVAVDAADQAERAWVGEVGPKLARAVRGPGGCGTVADADPAWALMLEGYDTEVHAAADSTCWVLLEPRTVQHRRRFRGWVSEGGIVPEAAWPRP